MGTSTTTREFIRNFSRLKKVAASGSEILVRDRKGTTFVFRAQAEAPTLDEQLSDLRGAFQTGNPVKSLKGFGRNRR